MLYDEPPPRLLLPGRCEHVPGTFWKADLDFVDELAEFLRGRPVLEIFAGNGYLAAWLQSRGVATTATTVFSGHDRHECGLYCPVEALEASEAVMRYGGQHAVLLVCWPTVTEAVLRAARLWGPSKDIVFIGEVTDYNKNQLGSCASDTFFEQMAFRKKFDAYRGSVLESALVGRLLVFEDEVPIEKPTACSGF